jgi:hypothetical protein
MREAQRNPSAAAPAAEVVLPDLEDAEAEAEAEA